MFLSINYITVPSMTCDRGCSCSLSPRSTVVPEMWRVRCFTQTCDCWMVWGGQSVWCTVWNIKQKWDAADSLVTKHQWKWQKQSSLTTRLLIGGYRPTRLPDQKMEGSIIHQVEDAEVYPSSFFLSLYFSELTKNKRFSLPASQRTEKSIFRQNNTKQENSVD